MAAFFDAVSQETSSSVTLPSPDGIATLGENSHNEETQTSLPLQVATGVYVTVHGHFYQPPRENPYLDAIERQAGASPFHDWNERIHHECYRPNAFARILNDRGEIVGIANNYEYLSFNIGPTLMSWLERYDIEVYQRILEADRKSCDRLNGHGNAIAQAYNHIILPLANERDKYTQIRWGIADFRSRFGRDPEGLWLAETAVDYPTLEALIAEGIKFIILAPSQAERCRKMPTADQPDPEWHQVGGGQIDPTRPYRCHVNDTEFIDIFFYDGPISRDMGFSDVLYNSNHFAGRVGQAVRGDHRPAQLISVATDGETFGHHKGGTEKTLAYAFISEFARHGWTVTNFAHYLSIHPPTWEVVLKPVTAWSCSHGVNRWQDDCGCGGGGLWHQQWRRPLRDALNWLRDQLIPVFETEGQKLFKDPWLARDEYIEVMRDRSSETVSRFLARHSTHKLNADEQVDALRLLEMQRHALFMYTSCGWFFEEISRPEGVQILRYAARAIELAGDVSGIQLEKAFMHRLVKAPSNVEFFTNGANVYRQLVQTAQINLKQVTAHYAISSLFHSYPSETQIYCYKAKQLDYQLQRMGSITLAVGQLQLISDITRESVNFVFAVMHLGGWDFHCCIQPFNGRRAYTKLKEKLFESLQQASVSHAILAMVKIFGDEAFSLQNLFAEERHRIMQLLTQETLTRVDQLYTQVYRDNYGVLMAFHRDELPAPQELQVAAEIALSHRCTMVLRGLEQANGDRQLALSHLADLEAIATEANHLRCKLNIPEAKPTLERLILRSLWQLLHDVDSATLDIEIERLERLIDLGNQLHLGLALDRCQELYFNCLHSQIVPRCFNVQIHKLDDPTAGTLCTDSDTQLSLQQIQQLFSLGQKLAVDVSPFLEC